MKVQIFHSLSGIVQGLTEFFPVSSSAHLVFIQKLFKFNQPGVVSETIAHLGTVIALIIFLRKDILQLRRNFRLVLLLAISTLTTGVLILPIKSSIENFFDSPQVGFYSAMFLLITGIVLFIADKLSPKSFSGNSLNAYSHLSLRAPKGSEAISQGKLQDVFSKQKHLNIINAIIIGIAQAVAVLPGISRSGMTISAGLLLGLPRETAVKFAFLISIPTILGASIIELKDVSITSWGMSSASFLLCFIFAFISGLVALHIVSKFVKEAKLHYFSYYCWTIGLIAILSTTV